MIYKKDYVIAITIAAITLVLVTSTSFTHYYPQLAIAAKTTKSKSNSGGGGTVSLGSSGSSTGSSSASTTSAANPNSLTSKELKSFTSCITTANKSQGLTHKIVTGCLDTAKGITPLTTTTPGAAPSAGAGSGSTGSEQYRLCQRLNNNII